MWPKVSKAWAIASMAAETRSEQSRQRSRNGRRSKDIGGCIAWLRGRGDAASAPCAQPRFMGYMTPMRPTPFSEIVEILVAVRDETSKPEADDARRFLNFCLRHAAESHGQLLQDLWV